MWLSLLVCLFTVCLSLHYVLVSSRFVLSLCVCLFTLCLINMCLSYHYVLVSSLFVSSLCIGRFTLCLIVWLSLCVAFTLCLSRSGQDRFSIDEQRAEVERIKNSMQSQQHPSSGMQSQHPSNSMQSQQGSTNMQSQQQPSNSQSQQHPSNSMRGRQESSSSHSQQGSSSRQSVIKIQQMRQLQSDMHGQQNSQSSMHGQHHTQSKGQQDSQSNMHGQHNSQSNMHGNNDTQSKGQRDTQLEFTQSQLDFMSKHDKLDITPLTVAGLKACGGRGTTAAHLTDQFHSHQKFSQHKQTHRTSHSMHDEFTYSHQHAASGGSQSPRSMLPRSRSQWELAPESMYNWPRDSARSFGGAFESDQGVCASLSFPRSPVSRFPSLSLAFLPFLSLSFASLCKPVCFSF